MTENGRQRGTLLETVQRELRVVSSRNRSPLPLRIVKWVLFLAVTRRLHGTRWFWVWVLGLPLAGLATHLLYRHKTQGWTRSWGGWKDVEVANPMKPYRDKRVESTC